MPSIHAVHPYLLHLGHVALPTFGVLAAVGLMLALALSERTALLAGVDPETLWGAGIFAVLCAYVTSRLLLIATYWRAFRAFPVLVLAVPSLTAGGLALTLVAVVVWLRFKHIQLLAAFDAWAPCAALLWAMLAMGHFFEGSDPGLATSFATGLRLPGETSATHPVALYVALFAALLTLLLALVLRSHSRRGTTAALGLMLGGLAQFLFTFVRQPGTPTVLGLDALEWVAAAMIAAGAMLYGVAQMAPD